MTLIALILFLNPIFASGISFTTEQCQRFKNEGITGGDYYINEALARDCKIHVPEGNGYFPPMVLNPNETHKKNCGMKNLALDGNNSGYFQDVVTFNNMHPDYFYPDRGDEYPFVFIVQTPHSDSSGVAVNIDSIDGCRNKIENLVNSKLDNKNVILTTAHSLLINKDKPDCRIMDNTDQSILAAGADLGKKPFVTRADKVICATTSCNELNEDDYNDFCVIIPKNKIPIAAEYEKLSSNKLDEQSFLVAYQPALVSSLRNRNIKISERIISVNKDGHVLQNKNKFVESKDDFILHHSDAAEGSSGGGIFSKNKKLFGIGVSGVGKNSDSIQRGYKYTPAVNYAIDPQIACQRLSTVLN